MKDVLSLIRCAALVIAAALVLPASSMGQEPASTNDWREGYTMVVLDTAGVQATTQTQEFIVSQGGRIAIVVPPRVLLGWIPAEIEPKLVGKMGIASIHRTVVDIASRSRNEPDTQAAMRFFNHVVSGESKATEIQAAAQFPAPLPLINCVKERPAPNPNDVQANLTALGIAPSPGSGPSDYMTGRVAVALFFIESNGRIDANNYTWSPSDEQDTYNRALAGLSWWPSQAAKYGESLSFTVVRYSAASGTCQQGYEPINHPSTDDYMWINAIMANLGYNSGDYLSRVIAFDLSLRTTQHTDWAYSVFIGYNPPGAATTFTDGYFAYNERKGGPLVQMLFVNDGWGAVGFGKVLTHETGHIFWACDEYYRAGYGGCTDCGICANAPGRSIENGNCEFCNSMAVDCMMRANSDALCNYTPAQIGWLKTSVLNDACNGAVALTDNVYYQQNTASATDESVSCDGAIGKGVWFTFAPSVSGSATVDTCLSDFDTQIAIFSGSCSSLNSIDCSDDSCGVQSSVTFNCTAGTTYRICAGGYNGASGNLQIRAHAAVSTFTVTPSAGDGGQISPSTPQTVNRGGSVSFSASPFGCHEVDQWLTNGVLAQTGGTSYTLANVQDDTTVRVTFKLITYTITASAGTGGTISPSGTFTRNCGDSQSFTATPNAGYDVDRWYVNSVSQQAGGRTYPIPYISQNLTVQVTFLCVCSLSSASASYSADGGTGSVSISTGATCNWTATTNVCWLSVVSGRSGTGNGTVTYSVAPNPSTSTRNGTVTIAGCTHYVQQAGRGQPGVLFANCGYSGFCIDGSEKRPYTNVTAAYQTAISGDTLRMFSCNYPETITFSKPLRLEATNGIVNIGHQ